MFNSFAVCLNQKDCWKVSEHCRKFFIIVETLKLIVEQFCSMSKSEQCPKVLNICRKVLRVCRKVLPIVEIFRDCRKQLHIVHKQSGKGANKTFKWRVNCCNRSIETKSTKR